MDSQTQSTKLSAKSTKLRQIHQARGPIQELGDESRELGVESRELSTELPSELQGQITLLLSKRNTQLALEAVVALLKWRAMTSVLRRMQKPRHRQRRLHRLISRPHRHACRASKLGHAGWSGSP